MLLEFDPLVQQRIFQYLDLTDCCIPSSLSNMSFTNKVFRQFIKNHFKINHIKVIKCNGCTDIKWSVQELCYRCSDFTPDEHSSLERILYIGRDILKSRYNDNYKSNDTIFDDYPYTSRRSKNNNYMNNVHFEYASSTELFIKKILFYTKNIKFNYCRCCDGKGCEFNIHTDQPTRSLLFA